MLGGFSGVAPKAVGWCNWDLISGVCDHFKGTVPRSDGGRGEAG